MGGLRLTEQEYEVLKTRQGHPVRVPKEEHPAFTEHTDFAQRRSKLEIRYEVERLRPRELAGEIWYSYEAVKFKLAKKTWYSPDFTLWRKADGRMECIEVKGGFMRDDAAVKLKVCARLFPEVRFILARTIGRASAGLWHERVIPSE